MLSVFGNNYQIDLSLDHESKAINHIKGLTLLSAPIKMDRVALQFQLNRFFVLVLH